MHQLREVKKINTIAMILSIFAIVVSFFSILMNYLNAKEQEKRWDKINLAKFVINKSHILKRKIIPLDTIQSMDTRIPILSYPESSSPGQSFIPYYLGIFDSNNVQIAVSEYLFTLNEIEEINKKLNGINITVARVFTAHFQLQNYGNTTANDVLAKIYNYQNNNWELLNEYSEITKFEAKEINTLEVTFVLPIDLDRNYITRFKIEIQYKNANDEIVIDEFFPAWYLSDNKWGIIKE